MNGPPVMVYVIGEPGVGKSTAMASATAGHLRAALPGSPAREALLHPASYDLVAVELGVRRPGFPGTDALPMDINPVACRYLTSGQAAAETPILVGEGARLGNTRFLAAAADSGWRVHLVHILGAEVAATRRRARGTHQHPAWVAGAATRAARLSASPPPRVRVHYIDTGSEPHCLIRDLAGLPALQPA